MEARIRNRFGPEILAEAASRFGSRPEALRELAGAESFIFEFSRSEPARNDERELILRIGHSLRRSPNLIRGEVDWINYLAAHGAGVAKAVDSARGELVESIPDGAGGEFLATAFVRAAGQAPPWSDQSPEFLEM